MTPKRFTALFLSLVLTLSVLVMGVNYLVDPLLYFRGKKVIYASAERQFKHLNVGNTAHNALLLGSSRMALVNPKDIHIDGLTFFNAAFSSALPEEMLAFANLHARNQKVVVIGIDFYAANKASFPPKENPFKPKHWEDKFKYLLSLDTLKYTYDHVKKSALGEAPFALPTGQRHPDYADRTPVTNLSQTRYKNTLLTLKSVHYNNIEYASHRVETYKNLKTLLELRGITPVFIHTPLNEVVYKELIAGNPDVAPYFQRWQRDLTTALGEHYIDLSRNPKLADFRQYYKDDPHHYLPEVGAAFIEESLHQFGL